MKVLVLDRGAAEIVYPADWSATLERDGHMRLADPTDSCSLEVSLLPFRMSQKVEVPVDQILRETFTGEDHPCGQIHVEVRGDLRLAWTDSAYDCEDPERGRRREAQCRRLLGCNGIFVVLLSFNYRHDDAEWVIPAWQRIVASLQLGNGSPLAGPAEHWSLRKPS